MFLPIAAANLFCLPFMACKTRIMSFLLLCFLYFCCSLQVMLKEPKTKNKMRCDFLTAQRVENDVCCHCREHFVYHCHLKNVHCLHLYSSDNDKTWKTGSLLVEQSGKTKPRNVFFDKSQFLPHIKLNKRSQLS